MQFLFYWLPSCPQFDVKYHCISLINLLPIKYSLLYSKFNSHESWNISSNLKPQLIQAKGEKYSGIQL